MTSRGCRVRRFADLHFAIDQRYGTRQMRMKAWRAASIASRLVFVCGPAPVGSLWIERLEHQATVVTEEFVHPHHSE